MFSFLRICWVRFEQMMWFSSIFSVARVYGNTFCTLGVDVFLSVLMFLYLNILNSYANVYYYTLRMKDVDVILLLVKCVSDQVNFKT